MEAVQPQHEIKCHLNDNEGYNGENAPTWPGWYHAVYAIYNTLTNISHKKLVSF